MELINHRQVYFNSENISKDFINNIINFVKSNSDLQMDNGNYNFNKKEQEHSGNERKVWQMPKTNETEEFVRLILRNVKKANELYSFDIEKILNIFYMEYDSEDSASLEYHMDIGPYPFNQRKLSFSLLVNDPLEYEGGQLEIWRNNNEFTLMPKDFGTIAIFPSFIPHRVTATTKGVRKAFVGFIGGPSYK
jgi:predicted 2-oxoglutarate/Fe(II)-dependent dioxygenase YbiX